MGKKANGIKVINTPVGFKEIANAIKKDRISIRKRGSKISPLKISLKQS